MNDREQKEAAKRFAEFWKDKGYEKGETQKFWLSLLAEVLDVKHPAEYISFEDQVMLDNTSFMDGRIDATHVLIEQKSLGKDLRKAIKQSDGTYLTPFQQAKRYSSELPYDKRPRWIITCNFGEFLIYDMNNPQSEPSSLLLKNLPAEYYRLKFIVDEKNHDIARETELSVKAGELVGKLYDAISKKYINPNDPSAQRSLNVLCVRIVFCLYAEDAGLFGAHSAFHDYVRSYNVSNLRSGLIDLFKILNTKEEERDPYLNENLLAFPYVNGGLFADEKIIIPQFDEEIADIICKDCSEQFDWSQISPTIFGAVFESTLNPETRRSGGMHYTSIENIHKVIGPLFLDDLKNKLADIKDNPNEKKRNLALQAYQDLLAGLTFLDPACGSGNFLTETYICLRRLENEALKARYGSQMLVTDEPIKVSINQFYGIEINDFAVTVSKTALWIAESQMIKETEEIIRADIEFFPLTTNATIAEGNALRMDWNEVVPKEKLNYIMGNPPFVGYSLQSREQKDDIRSIYVDENKKPYKTAGKIDYVAGWYFKAAQMIRGTNVRAALVSTNSITQGEQVAGVWKPLYDRFNVHIDFAWKTFKWGSEASDQAAVHCVIVGFSSDRSTRDKFIFANGAISGAKNISPYLIDAPNVFIESRNKPICEVTQMVYGNKPVDGGYLYLTPEERTEALAKEPKIGKFIRRIYGSDEYINNKLRYCLWLVGANPSEIRKSKFIRERVESVRNFRLASTKEATRKSADRPTLFQEIRQPSSEYIIVPSVSSENRRYVPLGFITPEIIVNNLVHIIPDATLYHFGVLTSNVHMAWMRTVCGRLEMRYRYSKDIVYNNFPWPEPTAAQKEKIEKTAQAILDARALYPDSSLADLYDELTMPPELRKAHQENDKAVMTAYGWDWRGMLESECVAKLMRLYKKLAAK